MARMSFAILRHGKISSTSKGAAIAHNHRTGNIDQVNIDGTMKHLNRCFMGEGLADRISALLPQKMRKDAVVAVEVLLTSGPEFFDGIEKDRAKLSKNPRFLDWVQKTLDWAKKEFGSNLVDATLHMDESTPHLHLMAVPLTKDARLCAKEVMARTELQRRQTDYAKAMEPFGLRRGDPAVETKRRHIGLKENPASGGKTAQLEAQLAKARADLARLQKLSKEWSDADLAKVKIHKAELIKAIHERDLLETKVAEMDKYTEKLNTELVAANAKASAALREKAEAIRAQVEKGEKSEELLKTAHGHDKAAWTLEKIGLEATNALLVEQAKARLEADPVLNEANNKLLADAMAYEALEAFETKWAGVGVANADDVRHLPLAAVCGQRAVYSRGKGVYVMHEFAPGERVPQLQDTEQQKGGIAR